MTNYEMTEQISEKMGVSLEEAKEALETCSWDMLDAALLLEKQKRSAAEADLNTSDRSGAAGDGEARSGKGDFLHRAGVFCTRLLAAGNRNRFEMRRKNSDEVLLDMPVTVLVILLLLAFWVCVPVLIIGLFAGMRYSFSGRELGRVGIKRAMNKAGDAADRVMEEIRKDD